MVRRFHWDEFHLDRKRLLHNPWIPRLTSICTGYSRGWCGPKLRCLAIGRCRRSNVGWIHHTSNHWDGEPFKKDERSSSSRMLDHLCNQSSEITSSKMDQGPKSTPISASPPFWPRRKVELTLDDGEPSIHDLTMMTVTTGETFGGGYRVVPNMHPTRKDGSIVLAYRLSRLQMLSLMGPVKKGKHVGKWGIEQIDVNKVSLRPIDQMKPIRCSRWSPDLHPSRW